MADNIKIIGSITNIDTVDRYLEEDVNLFALSQNLQENFGGNGDYIEYYIYDIGGNLLNTNYNYLNYKLPPTKGLTPSVSNTVNTTGNIQETEVGIESTLATPTSSIYPVIEIDPVTDIQNQGYSSGEFSVRYNFFKNIISNNTDRALFVKEISQDRTEIRLASVTIPNSDVEEIVSSLIDEINSSPYYIDYLLNFGNNEQYVAVNIALNREPGGYEILFKLYQPLPLNIQEKQTLWVVKEKANPYVFNINLDRLVIPPPPPTLRGPNFDIPIDINQGTVSSTYTNYSTLVSGLQSLQSSSYQRLLNLLTSQSIQINVDYQVSESADFGNFVFFGSAYKRVENFYNKVKQIEGYNNFIKTYTPFVSTTASLQNEINLYSSSINTIISEFDGFESYLYFESSSYSWPKLGSSKPFTLLSTGSVTTWTWYNAFTGSAKTYDLNNYNNLEYAVPTFLKDDENNQPFLTFLNMVGHYFDNIWIYLKSIPDVNKANNNLNEGISRDLVYEKLKSLGLKLYNSQAGENVDQFLIGANTGSSTWDNNFTITGSYLNNIPRKDLVSELYKRIYHNLPYLLKTKGTVEGLNNLMTVFGIPNKDYYVIENGNISDFFYTPTGSNFTSSILNVKEYGGSLKSNLIKGYNNNKVRIVENSIVPGVNITSLSPLISLQTYPTASSKFRDGDMNYIDISFSPQTQIDTYISKSIASNTSTNPTWSLDEFIGDPGYLYSSSYTPLDTERRIYYQTGVSGFRPFTSSLLDYNRYIRLIEYFDNALFKMLGDFVPERTSLSTGVTFNSPALERNKIYYANPSSITSSTETAAYTASSAVSTTYGTFYTALSSSNNTMGWYDGELSGSIVDVNQYFEDNYNPYLQPILPINRNEFVHSDWNILVNNVSQSVTSSARRRVEYFYGTTRSVLLPAELQDSYLSLQSYNNSRYSGTKLTSLNINTYTSASYTGSNGIDIQEGDKSFGKTAAIDRYVRRIGLFTQVESSSFLPKRNNVSLKYLVDEFGGLTELNLLNKNWEDIQRTFLLNTTGSVALFNSKQYSNQLSTNGDKNIFESGYSYLPVFYFGTGSVDKKLYFDPTLSELADNVTAKLSFNSNYRIIGTTSLTSTTTDPDYSGPTNPPYFLTSSFGTADGFKYVTNLFQNIVSGEQLFKSGGPNNTTGQYTNFPTYSVPSTGPYNFKVLLKIRNQTSVQTNNPRSITFKSEVRKFSNTNPAEIGIPEIPDFEKTITYANPEFGDPIRNLTSWNQTKLYIDWTTYNDTDIILGTKASIDNYILLPLRSISYSPYQPFIDGAFANITIYEYSLSDIYYEQTDFSGGQQISSKYYNQGSFTFIQPTVITTFPDAAYVSSNHPAPTLQDIFDIPPEIGTPRYVINQNSQWDVGPKFYSRFSTIPFSTATGNALVNRYSSASLSAPILREDFDTVNNIPGGVQELNMNIIPSSNLTLEAGEKLVYKLSISSSGNMGDIRTFFPFTASAAQGQQIQISSVDVSTGNYPFTNFTTAPTLYYISASGPSTLVLNNTLSSYYENYTYIPTFETGSSTYTSSLFSKYGEIDYLFTVSEGDIFRVVDLTGRSFESRVLSVSERDDGLVQITINDTMSNSLRDLISSTKALEVLFLKRIKDETNVLLKFIKKPGKTSYGFLIPNTLAPDVLANIDAITRQVKQKLLSDQQSST